MKNIVEIKGSVPFTTSIVIAEGVGIEHLAVMRLIKRYQHTETLSDFESQKVRTKGRPLIYAVLTEQQATFLVTLMDNNEKVVSFKEKLTNEFYRQRMVISALRSQRKDYEWQQQRVEGKIRYMQKTDTIKQFVDYATAQGSESAEKYYSNLAKMENSALFLIEQKYPNLREVLDLRQLMMVAVADDVIERALTEGMSNSLHYKECYKLAKERVIALAAVVGKSPVQRLIGAEKHDRSENI
jgi:phage regulator Rha-like protein